MIRNRTLAPSLVALGLVAAGCSGDGADTEPYDFTSAEATLVVFEFDGELIADSAWNVERLIEDQMLYTIGHLNADNSVGRLDKLAITDIERTQLEDGKTRVTYRATMPVGWGSKTNIPDSYELVLPLHVDFDDYQRFVDKYSHSCVDWGAHDVDTGSMWYYYRPRRSGCRLDAGDVFKTTASITISEENTSGEYPEYHKVWEDDALTVVAIFGKYEDGATTSSDAGIAAYNRFASEMQRMFGDGDLVTVPESVPSNPGIGTADITFRASLADGKSVEIVALLVDNVRTAGPSFDQRYNGLSADADMIFYNGHAGLGANIRALADKGTFAAGKYQIFFMNGCDTFAYVDNRLAEKKAELNEDDPSGTRYLDMVTNVMPSFFHSMPYASSAMIKGLLSYDDPQTYESIFGNIDSSEVVVVTGEEDNLYVPGYQPGGGSSWPGIEERGSVASGESRVHDLGTLPAGAYVFTTAHDPEQPGGDADLYLALGRTPTTDDYDERPYLNGSDESITVRLDGPTRVVVMVHGYEWADAATSAYLLRGQAVTE